MPGQHCEVLHFTLPLHEHLPEGFKNDEQLIMMPADILPNVHCRVWLGLSACGHVVRHRISTWPGSAVTVTAITYARHQGTLVESVACTPGFGCRSLQLVRSVTCCHVEGSTI